MADSKKTSEKAEKPVEKPVQKPAERPASASVLRMDDAKKEKVASG